MRPIISIIVCTCSRSASLRETLESIGRITVPSDLLAELLVVDNASTDQTPEVVRSAALLNMPVRYVHEPRKGKGYAYNTGMAEARGAIFLFTDDDVRVPTHWVGSMARPILNNEFDGIVGGVRLAPQLRRRWLVQGFPSLAACVETRERLMEGLMVGANMAFSRQVLEKVPGFDTELGPGALGFCEDTLFSMQLRKAGFRIGASAEASVEHHPDPERLLPRAVLATLRARGRSDAYLHYHWKHGSLWDWNWWMIVRGTIALTYRRLFKAAEWRCPDVPPYWSFHLVAATSFLKQFYRESNRPRNYAQFGLRRLSQDTNVSDPHCPVQEAHA